MNIDICERCKNRINHVTFHYCPVNKKHNVLYHCKEECDLVNDKDEILATCLDLTIKYFSLSELEYGVYLDQIENDGLMPSFIIDSFFRHNFNLGDIIECFFNKNLQKHHYITNEIDRDDWAEYYSHLNFELFDCDL